MTMLSVTGYGSDFEDKSSKRAREPDQISLNAPKPKAAKTMYPSSGPPGGYGASAFQKLDAFSRHKQLINQYVLQYGNERKQQFLATIEARIPKKTDADVIAESYRFIRENGDNDGSWESELALKYYEKLFRTYCLIDLSRYKEGKFGLRWRVEQEVIDGKGQFICGSTKCTNRDNLRSYEVFFRYDEAGVAKQNLVKCRVCPSCAPKMTHFKDKAAGKKPLKKGHITASSSQSTTEEEEEARDTADSLPSTELEAPAKPQEAPAATTTDEASSLWSKKLDVEKSKAEEFDDYFKGLFL
jgi:protein FRA10AC1